jgi:hypothetical protein
MNTKKIFIPVLGVLLLTGALVGAGEIYAQTPGNPFNGLAQMIAQKFNLNQSDVQTVLDQYKGKRQEQRQQQMQTKLEDRLTQLVKDGKLTEAQKQAVITKENELRNSYNTDAFKNMTPEQKRTEMQKKKDEFTTWAKSQGIDPTLLSFGFGFGIKGRGMGMGWGKGFSPTTTPTP